LQRTAAQAKAAILTEYLDTPESTFSIAVLWTAMNMGQTPGELALQLKVYGHLFPPGQPGVDDPALGIALAAVTDEDPPTLAFLVQMYRQLRATDPAAALGLARDVHCLASAKNITHRTAVRTVNMVVQAAEQAPHPAQACAEMFGHLGTVARTITLGSLSRVGHLYTDWLPHCAHVEPRNGSWTHPSALFLDALARRKPQP
jgi:hypothetical protein